MKGSEFRKRYVVVYSGKLSDILPTLERELSSVYRARRKYASGDYAIFLTNQFYKDQLIETVRKNFPGAEPIVTSGTMKKCKAVIEKHRMERELAGKEISTLLKN